ncbi:uncharacterized protein LOC123557827 [Mercenaria mercenaria]|uniref:uncharacterized protein LOC123557827 n=1 Tax=Mercenaria mercenaria TaxID=6596 RepID=UPI00234F52AF|nr:uncharacterized protein LOC123557827 [Mercenaria mercenaria]
MASENPEAGQMDFEISETISRPEVEDADTTGDPKFDQKVKNELNSKDNENPLAESNNDKKSDHAEENIQNKATCENEVDVIEERNKKKGTIEERYNDGKCEPCLFDEIEEDAVAFCAVCIEYLCKGCARDHRRSKVTRSHKVLDENEMPKDPGVFKMMKTMTACTEHPEIEVSFKCEKHKQFICTSCLAVNHRKCEEVTEVSKVQKSFIDGDTETSLSDMLQTINDVTVAARIAKEENIKKLHLDQACIAEERSGFIECLQEHLLNLDEKSKIETENILTEELKALEEEVDKCKEIENQEIKYKELLGVAMNYGSTVELNVISELVKKEAEKLKGETKKQEAKAAVRLTFESNQSFTDVATIGNVYVLRGEKKEGHQDENPRKQILLETSSDVIDETSSDARESAEKGPLMQSVVSRTRTMHDLHQSTNVAGLKCFLTSMVVLSDGRVVVTDHNNENIKILSLDFSVKMEYKVDGKPIDMCQTSRDNVAVIFDGKKIVNKYMVAEDAIHNDGGFPSKLYPISIVKSEENDNCVIILFSDEERSTQKRSDNDTIEIQIRSFHKGAILKQLTDFKTKSSHKLILENPGRIRVTPIIKDAFLVSENKKLHCFETDHSNANTIKEKWFYKSYRASNIDDITDIAVDREGNIYVCGKGSRNIHQISGSNFMNNRVLLSVPGSPQSLCVDDERRRLIVGCENDDFIYVIALE